MVINPAGKTTISYFVLIGPAERISINDNFILRKSSFVFVEEDNIFFFKII
ncbi:MAG: hypothetical protein ACOX43_05750 [Bacilli bacterium]